MKLGLKFAASLVQAMIESDEWARICREYVQIVDSDKELDRMEREDLKGVLTDKQRIAWSDAITDNVFAYTWAAMLYGLRVADTLRSAVTKPVEFSQYVMGLSNTELAE